MQQEHAPGSLESLKSAQSPNICPLCQTASEGLLTTAIVIKREHSRGSHLADHLREIANISLVGLVSLQGLQPHNDSDGDSAGYTEDFWRGDDEDFNPGDFDTASTEYADTESKPAGNIDPYMFPGITKLVDEVLLMLITSGANWLVPGGVKKVLHTLETFKTVLEETHAIVIDQRLGKLSLRSTDPDLFSACHHQLHNLLRDMKRHLEVNDSIYTPTKVTLEAVQALQQRCKKLNASTVGNNAEPPRNPLLGSDPISPISSSLYQSSSTRITCPEELPSYSSWDKISLPSAKELLTSSALRPNDSTDSAKWSQSHKSLDTENAQKKENPSNKILECATSRIRSERISPVDFTTQHLCNVAKSCSKTTVEFIEKDAVQSWVEKRDQVLLCYGESGTGKTISTSMLIQHISQRFEATRGIAYVFGDSEAIHRIDEHHAHDILLASLLKQLVLCITEPSMLLQEVEDFMDGKSQATDSLVSIIFARLPRSYLFIDGLDELPDHSQTKLFVSNIFRLQKKFGLNLLVTSKDPQAFAQHFGKGNVIAKNVARSDIQAYVMSRLADCHFEQGRIETIQSQILQNHPRR